MSDKPSTAHKVFAHIAPAVADHSGQVLFGDVRERTGLSPRDRSLITVANLVTLSRVSELPVHLKTALENGVSREELIEVIAHSAFSRRPAPEPAGDASHMMNEQASSLRGEH
ncbi:carboxymuconolactone decarboxylase family protein [Azotobacter beijerinckii]|uniref:carboxymuconolactone decarboxylase family protein n=1 Tax=Azotobacter beijerinckii TaxID=170623 RepID=UPI000AB706B3|nr:carboxymuconolactone decarboxylase family protein [Azotobacter beijerinckii]